MFRRILLAYDGSPHSERAFKVALDLAKRYGARVTAVSVAHVPDFADTRDEVNGAILDAQRFFGESLQHISTIAAEEKVELDTRVVPGHPADALVHVAETENYDLIVIGARGLSGVKRYLLGSVSEKTVQYAHCPVLVVKSR